MIFFNQADLESNHELTKIQDKELLQSITKDFWECCKDILAPESPWICGTIVPAGPVENMPDKVHSKFTRKLLMMRASTYTLMSLA